MNRLFQLLVLITSMLAAPAVATPGEGKPEVVERDAQGHATRVKSDGIVYDVCTAGRTDGCINPRDAGLDEGNRPIDYWPGKPASEIDHPLPVEKTDSAGTANHPNKVIRDAGE